MAAFLAWDPDVVDVDVQPFPDTVRWDRHMPGPGYDNRYPAG